MVGKIEKTPQLNIFKVPLLSFIREGHELCLLANKIDWDLVEKILVNITVWTMVAPVFQYEKLLA